ncbi:MAG: hypothetical protein QM775_36605 [Pirellulales bacterium]
MQAGETWHIDVFRVILARMEAEEGQGGKRPVAAQPAAQNPNAAPIQQAANDAAGQEI